MYWKLLKNDIKNNLLQSFNIAFFIVLSVAFLSAGGQLAVHLNNSIQHLLTSAKTPHLLQMHTGDIDSLRMENFVKNHPQIEDYQILPFLNIDNALLSFGDRSLKDSIYDNGFSVQSTRFDYLLDMEGNRIKAAPGEVYVPLYYHTSGMVEPGEVLTIRNRPLTIAGFVRDSQMNSSLSSSRRFIVHASDFELIKNEGTLEHLIEFRLQDIKDIAKIEDAYRDAGLESNGPPLITYPLFKMVNAFSDGISILALMIISLLIISICLLCIRFTLFAKLEEDHRELAILRAIGIPYREIKRIFLGKYLLIAALSSLLGYALSFLVKIPFLRNMKMFFGEPQPSVWVYIVAFILSMSVFVTVLQTMNRLSKSIRHLRMSSVFLQTETPPTAVPFALPRFLQLSVSDFWARRKVYRTMITVFVLTIFVLTLPYSILSTISHKEFVNYLGLGNYDLRFDLSQPEAREHEVQQLIEELKNDNSVEKIDVFKSKLLSYRSEDGENRQLWVDFGNTQTFPIRYIQGKAPTGADEIALSKLKADEIDAKVGDTLNLTIHDHEKKVRIVGIFSDVTNGGKTAKASFGTTDSDIIWLIIPLTLKDGVNLEDFVDSYQAKYPFAKISDMQSYVEQIFGNTISMVRIITQIAFGLSVFLIFLITTLFVRMLYVKDASQNALLKALGFTNAEIRKSYLIKSALILLLGLSIGNLLTVILGDKIGAAALSLIGIFGVKFVRSGLFSYLLVPLSMLVTTLSATYFGVAGLSKMNIAHWLKEE